MIDPGSTDPVTTVRVVVVDDDPLVRSALELMLGGRSDLEVVGTARDGREGVELAERLCPDVVLMDIRMPVLDGLRATEMIRARNGAPRVIVLTTFDADEHVLAAVEGGADGFLLKDTPPADIVTAIRRVAEGEPMLSPSATQTLMRRIRAGGDPRTADAETRLATLTERERDVALAVGRGLSNAEIAAELYMSVATVKAHMSRLFDKMGATNRVQIAIQVHAAGLV